MYANTHLVGSQRELEFEVEDGVGTKKIKKNKKIIY